jgi:hypothetical protein
MKKRFLASLVTSILLVVFVTIPNATTSFAQCKCTCGWTCAGTCPYQCSGCGLGASADAGASCCERAPSATGCGEEEWIY